VGKHSQYHEDFAPPAAPAAPAEPERGLDASDLGGRIARLQGQTSEMAGRIAEGALYQYYTDPEGRNRLVGLAEEHLPPGTTTYGGSTEERAKVRAELVMPLEAVAQQSAGGGVRPDGSPGSKWAQRLNQLFMRADFNPDWLQDAKNNVQFGRAYSAVNLPKSIGSKLIRIMADARKDFEKAAGSDFNVEYTEPERGIRIERYKKTNFSWKKSWVALNNWFLPMLVEHGLVTQDYIEMLRGRRVPALNQGQAAADVRRQKRAAGNAPRASGSVRVGRRSAPEYRGHEKSGLYTSAMAGKPVIEGPGQYHSAYMVGSNPVQHMHEMKTESGLNRFRHLLEWGVQKSIKGRARDYTTDWIKPVENHPFQVQMASGASAQFPTLVVGRRGERRSKVDKEALGNQLAWIACQDLYKFHAEQEAKGYKIPTGVAGSQWDTLYSREEQGLYNSWAEGGRASFETYFRRDEQQMRHMRPYLYDHLSDWMVGKRKSMGLEELQPRVRGGGKPKADHYRANAVQNPLHHMYSTNKDLDDIYKTLLSEDDKGHFGPEGTYMNEGEKNMMLRDFQWDQTHDLLVNYPQYAREAQAAEQPFHHKQRRQEFVAQPAPVSRRIHTPARRTRPRVPPRAGGRPPAGPRRAGPKQERSPPRSPAARLDVPSRSRSPTPAPAFVPPVQIRRGLQPQVDLGAMAPERARPAYELAARNLQEVAVRADELAPGYYGIGRQHYHLMHDLTGAQPMMGRAHIVRADVTATSKHWMHDVEGDINGGATALMVKGRRGPFKDQRGRSQVLDRSAHVLYRRRHRTMEVTVKRGVSDSEMDLLMSKILSQQVSAPGTSMVMVKGNKRYPMGPVSGVRVKTLRSLVYECLDKYSTCGLHLVEGGKVGSMAKKLVNSAAFKVDVQRHRGLFAL
jgi:hypothetical protein